MFVTHIEFKKKESKVARKSTDFEYDGFKAVDSIPAPIRATKWTRLLTAVQESGQKIVAKEYDDAKGAASAVLGIRNAIKKYPEAFGSFEVVRRQDTVYIENKAL